MASALAVFATPLRAQTNWIWTQQTNAPVANWYCLAASADATKLAAAVLGGGIYTSTNAGATWRQTGAPNQSWVSVASSADGAKLAAVAFGGGIYTSTNAGVTWRQTGAPNNQYWASIASSSDGAKLAAADNATETSGGYINGGIDVSTNAGSSWVQTSAPDLPWNTIASSADGTRLVAAVFSGGLYTSTNSGISWTLMSNAPSADWSSVATSADGNKLVAVVEGGGIYTSTNSGASWTATDAPSTNWLSVASSADGTRLAACVGYGGGIYASTDSGNTWTQTAAPIANWYSVVSSASGDKLAGAVYGGGIYTVQYPPVITNPPVSLTNIAGTTATFSVTAVGTTPFSYAWYKGTNVLTDGGNVSGSATTTLTLTNVQDSDATNYNVVITNAAGSVTSSVVTLTVIDPPVITNSPANRTNNAGSTATFTVTTSSGTTPFNYTWYKGATALTNGGNVSGSATATLTLANVQDADAANYTVVLTNIAGSATSSVAKLTVIDPPKITTQPTNQTIIAGTTATFSVTATSTVATYSGITTNTGPFGYAWYKGATALTDGGNVSGATNTTLTITNVNSANNAGSYHVVITNVAGSVTSSNATLVVVDPPVIAANSPASLTTNVNSTAKFTVTTSSGTAPFSYTWYRGANALTNGGNVSGSSTATLTLTNVQNADATNYFVVLTNAAGSATSSVATLTLNLAITAQPVSRTNVAGTTATFTVTVAGTAPTYQWRKNSQNISGATNATLTLTNVSDSDAAYYQVVVTNATSKVNSSSAQLTVLDRPGITAGPASQIMNAGSTATFTVTASGTATLGYTWYRKLTGDASASALTDVDKISGSATATLTLTNVSDDDTADYTVVVTNAVGSVTSSVAALTVVSVVYPPPPSPGILTNCPGDQLAFPFQVYIKRSDPSLGYQWRLNGNTLTNGVNFANVTTDTLKLPSLSLGDTGNYDVVVTNAAGSVTSAVAVLTVSYQPAKATIVVTNGFIVSATVTEGGCNYTSPPVLYFSGDGGSGAAGFAQISSDGFVTNIVITNPGSGYPSNAVIQIAPAIYPVVSLARTNLPAAATPVIAYGFVVGATVTSPGLGYVNPPAVSFNDGGGGAGAVAQAQIGNGSVTHIVITSAGSGYSANTVVNLTPPDFPAVLPGASNLMVGESYQWQVANSFSGWTNYAAPFTATNTSVTPANYWNTGTVSPMFFRLQILP